MAFSASAAAWRTSASSSLAAFFSASTAGFAAAPKRAQRAGGLHADNAARDPRARVVSTGTIFAATSLSCGSIWPSAQAEKSRVDSSLLSNALTSAGFASLAAGPRRPKA